MVKATKTTGGDRPRPRPHKAAIKRRQMRDSLWSDASEVVWDRQAVKGFTSVPRLLPLVTTLMSLLQKNKTKKLDLASVYVDLWCRAFDDSYVQVEDEDSVAYSAGYTGPRAVRSWRERVYKLQELGFLRFQGEGNRDIAHILLLNPLTVCCRLRDKKPSEVPGDWWTAFQRRALAIGAKLELPQPSPARARPPARQERPRKAS